MAGENMAFGHERRRRRAKHTNNWAMICDTGQGKKETKGFTLLRVFGLDIPLQFPRVRVPVSRFFFFQLHRNHRKKGERRRRSRKRLINSSLTFHIEDFSSSSPVFTRLRKKKEKNITAAAAMAMVNLKSLKAQEATV